MQCNSPLKDRVPKAILEYVRRAIESWTQLDPFLIRLRQENKAEVSWSSSWLYLTGQ